MGPDKKHVRDQKSLENSLSSLIFIFSKALLEKSWAFILLSSYKIY